MREKQQKQLEQVYSCGVKILTFLAQRGRLATPNLFREALDAAYAARSLRALRAGVADLQQRTESLPPNEREQLIRELGNDPIQAILDRGEIRTADEYRLVLSRVDEVADSEMTEQVDQLNTLLERAHDRLSQRG